MQILEILILLALLPVLAGFFFSRRRRPAWLRTLPGLALLLTVIDLALGEYRWQMVPAYVLVVLVCLLALRRPATDTARSSWWRGAGRFAGEIGRAHV